MAEPKPELAPEKLVARYRPYRVAVWAVYFVVLLFFAGSITVSVIKSVLEMSPDHRPPAPSALSADECLTRARALWVELDEHRKAMSTQAEVRRVDAEYWPQFRLDWLERHRAAEADCAVGSAGRENLKEAFKRLEQAMDLYTTHATQFAGEVGPTLDELKRVLDAG
ncbi:MAG: hypothetical protein JNK82_02610 [Myxococcaceae bacterium]|nr:hypothetical protein [Myxococcaceae bacterium]